MQEYVFFDDQSVLIEEGSSLVSASGKRFPIVNLNGFKIPNFINDNGNFGDKGKFSLDLYNQNLSVQMYNNFKSWLFETFEENETQFRSNLASKVINGQEKRILITGCGMGDDILPCVERTNFQAQVYATDLAAEMIGYTSKKISENPVLKNATIKLSICDACNLPFASNFFDAAFHFGGINLFDNLEKAIHEMARVVRLGGKIGFGDESVAPWLRNVDYGKMAMTNNCLWSALPPLDLLPFEAVDVNLEWILGNCFYFLTFSKSEKGPYMNIDIPHKGSRGGTMRTRFYGLLEGVSEESKRLVIEEAKKQNTSVYDWLEKMIKRTIGKRI